MGEECIVKSQSRERVPLLLLPLSTLLNAQNCSSLSIQHIYGTEKTTWGCTWLIHRGFFAASESTTENGVFGVQRSYAMYTPPKCLRHRFKDESPAPSGASLKRSFRCAAFIRHVYASEVPKAPLQRRVAGTLASVPKTEFPVCIHTPCTRLRSA
ncbi:hypothetical protein C8R47DRAFT_175950 [Mycena vitilis]|nr:hypothetical protein C8R47DRAFT_175950 [Mycena vitilis]